MLITIELAYLGRGSSSPFRTGAKPSSSRAMIAAGHLLVILRPRRNFPSVVPEDHRAVKDRLAGIVEPGKKGGILSQDIFLPEPWPFSPLDSDTSGKDHGEGKEEGRIAPGIGGQAPVSFLA